MHQLLSSIIINLDIVAIFLLIGSLYPTMKLIIELPSSVVSKQWWTLIVFIFFFIGAFIYIAYEFHHENLLISREIINIVMFFGAIFVVLVASLSLNTTLKMQQMHSLQIETNQQKQIEQSLKESEKKFRMLVESTSDWIWEVDKNGVYTYISPQVEKLLGYHPKELIGKTPFDLMPQYEVERIGRLFKEMVEQNKPIIALENVNIHKDGSRVIIETSGVPFFDNDGKLLGYRGVDRDVTERETIIQTLRESEEKFRSITTSAQDAIIMMDEEGKISYWNQSAEQIFGYSQEEVIGKLLHTLLAPQRFLEAHYRGLAHFKKTGEGPVLGKTVELAAIRKDGTEFPLELSLSVTTKEGKWNAIGIIRDITERKEMQNELKLKDEMMMAQSKQAAMGDMIAMIAHQWRQPLAVISMDVNNLQASIELEEEITNEYLLEHANTIYEQLKQLSETIDNFRNFFKPDQSTENTTLKDVLDSALKIIGKSLENNNIALHVNNMSNSSLCINKASLIQVLLNILGNAKDIFVINKISNAHINVEIKDTEDGAVISICDNAGGISENIINKLCEPYFTTKQEYNGTGLGLYISKTIIEKHLFGTLSWYNKNEGACFEVAIKMKEHASYV